MSEPFRFLHLSDLRLGEPVSGVRDPSEHLKQELLESPYKALEQACDLAIREGVEFVLLTGNALDLHHPSPRPLSFLQRQFRRLLKEGIEVYWCSGPLDPAERWPTALELPENVTVFATPKVEVVKIRNEKGPVCTLLAGGATAEIEPSDFRGLAEDDFVLGAVNGIFPIEDLTEIPCDYWALGGSRSRRAIAKESHLAIYPGTPQARSPQQRGAHGVNLVAVDPARGVHSKEVACDRVRFATETVTVDKWQPELIRDAISQRCLELASEINDRWLVIDWTLRSEKAEAWKQLSATQQTQMLNWLRKEFAGKHSGLWSNQLSIETTDEPLPKKLTEEDSILGDFLRSLPQWETEDQILELVEQLDLPSEWSSTPWRDDLLRFDRNELLNRVRVLGLEILSGSTDS